MNMNLHIPSQRQMRLNIWRGLLSASDQEIRDGMDFYPGAHGLCRMFGKLFSLSPESVAGIYAALSPMNGWESNVSDVLSVLRYTSSRDNTLSFPVTNTPKINRDKAIRIANGEDPLSVLRGRKVTSFYRGICNPSDLSPIPVDRHLICLALNSKFDKNQLSRLASNKDLYSRVEQAYSDLGYREGLGNRLASIAWFVQRRRVSSGQSLIPHPDSPYCCDRPMWRYGRKRFFCKYCKTLRYPQSVTIKATITSDIPISDILYDIDLPSHARLSLDVRNRPIIYLGKNYTPHVNSGGWNWLARYVVMTVTGEILRSDEHVHHLNGIKHDCTIDNLEVVLCERHGRYHGTIQSLYMLRDRAGRFVSSNVPTFAATNDLLSLSDIPF